MLHVNSTRLLSAQPSEKQPGLLLPESRETALVVLADLASARLPALRTPPSTGTPWLTSLLTTLVVVTGSALIVQHFSPKAEAQTSTPPESSEPVGVKPSPMGVTVVQETPYPFAHFVKVSEIRMIMDRNQRTQVQYLVANDSDTALTNIGVKIAVRSAGPEAAGPLFMVSARVPLLGPHESKEIRTDLDSDLRADVQVTSQQ